jgi:hypothetical protein
LTHIEFKGAIGYPLEVVGNRIDIRLNRGSIRLRGRPELGGPSEAQTGNLGSE